MATNVEVGTKLRGKFKGLPLNAIVTNISPDGIIDVSKILPTGKPSERIWERYDDLKLLLAEWQVWGTTKLEVKGGEGKMASNNSKPNGSKKPAKVAKPVKTKSPKPAAETKSVATAGQQVASKVEREKNSAVVSSSALSRASLNTAFQQIRRQGIMVWQNYKCCQLAASRAIAAHALAAVDEGKKINGVVFYTQRDQLDREAALGFHLSFGPIVCEKKTVGMPAKDLGNLIVEVLKKCGIRHKWSGDPADRILIEAGQ
jgi:hypothetical protein